MAWLVETFVPYEGSNTTLFYTIEQAHDYVTDKRSLPHYEAIDIFEVKQHFNSLPAFLAVYGAHNV